MACCKPFSFRFFYPKYWVSWLYIMLLFILAFLPRKVRYKLGGVLGRLVYKKNKKRRLIVNKNLTLTHPELTHLAIEKLTHDYFYWHYRGVVEYSCLFFRSNQWLNQRIDLNGLEGLSQAIHNNHNVIILLAHSVFLDFAPVALSSRFKVFGSYQPQKNLLLDWLIQYSRCRHVDQLIAREEGLLRLIRALKSGRVMIFLPDEDLGIKSSCFVPFFGIGKATLTTPARIGLLKDAVCFPAFVYFDPKSTRFQVNLGKRFKFKSDYTAEQNAVLMNSHLESVIKSEPIQYLWSMKLFRTQPKGKKSFY